MKKHLSHAHSQRTSPWKVFGIAAVLLTAATSAQAWVIDFDTAGNGSDIGHGQVIDNEYSLGIPGASVGVDISVSKYGDPDVAIAFDTGPYDSDDPDLRAPFYDVSSGPGDTPDGPISPGNILVIQENKHFSGDCVTSCYDPDDEADGGYFYFKFRDEDGDAKAVTIASIDFFDIENTEDGYVKFYGGSDYDTFLGSFALPHTGGDNRWDQVVYNIADVTKIKVKFGGSGGLDNIVGNIPGGGGGTGVPEPASLALLAGGLVGFAGIRRRRMRPTQEE